MTLHLTDFPATGPDLGDLFASPAAPLPAITLAVFTETAQFADRMAEMGRSRQFGRVKMTLAEGGLRAAIAAYTDAPAPRFLLIETDAGPQELLAGLESLSELCDPETRLLVVGGENDIALYRELIRRGVSDYLPRPISTAAILKSLSDVTSQGGAATKGPVTAFLGACGGAGSSTVALNAAWLAGQALHGPVGLIDLDLDFGTAGVSLALDGARGVIEAFRAGANLDGQLLDGLFDSYDANLRVLVATDATVLADAPAPEVVDHLTDLARSGGHAVMLDLPGIGSAVTRRALLAADGVVVTTTPDLAGLKNCRKVLDIIAGLRPDDPKPLVVLNKIGLSKRTEIAAHDFAQTLGITLSASLPFDAKGLAHSANLGRVHVATSAGRGIASALKPLVQALTGSLTGHVAKDSATPAKAALPALLQRLLRSK